MADPMQQDPLQDPNAQSAAQGVAQGAETEAPEDEGSYEIVIKVSGDGSIKVGVEGTYQGEENEDESSFQPVSSIKTALQVAMDIFKNAGQMQDAQAGQDSMDAGYGAPKKPAPAAGAM